MRSVNAGKHIKTRANPNKGFGVAMLLSTIQISNTQSPPRIMAGTMYVLSIQTMFQNGVGFLVLFQKEIVGGC